MVGRERLTHVNLPLGRRRLPFPQIRCQGLLLGTGQEEIHLGGGGGLVHHGLGIGGGEGLEEALLFRLLLLLGEGEVLQALLFRQKVIPSLQPLRQGRQVDIDRNQLDLVFGLIPKGQEFGV